MPPQRPSLRADSPSQCINYHGVRDRRSQILGLGPGLWRHRSKRPKQARFSPPELSDLAAKLTRPRPDVLVLLLTGLASKIHMRF